MCFVVKNLIAMKKVDNCLYKFGCMFHSQWQTPATKLLKLSLLENHETTTVRSSQFFSKFVFSEKESALDLPACVSLDDELLICGGSNSRNCYSYHLGKREYKLVCSYPNDATLGGHTVVLCPPRSSTEDTFTLISFGVSSLKHKPLQMEYESVWNERKSTTASTRNEWTPIMDTTNEANGQSSINLQGCRGVVSGLHNDLLFVTRYPNKIDVLSMQTWTPLKRVQNNTVPLSITNTLEFHCFVSIGCNEFLLVSQNNCISIRFNQQQNKFSYDFWPLSPFSLCWIYSYVLFQSQLLIFGGWNFVDDNILNVIFTLDISRKFWSRSLSHLPLLLYRNTAIADSTLSSVHLIGGRNSDFDNQANHFVVHAKDLTGVILFF
ncbi:hypothetical protein RFI_22535 [Reticulomyxa filosa]|uniref:Uncharacterized protein n=1 Tax=Reticulomyxa filosa TaxID=46433 RepID=X6MN25_RETFI|nr:hypothetical protein RFI_22535 [Reticulomyxa filosa]|eukprot:ETO14832.1 hypothetical protein RFI_22535 [Reticulomyxa filosa]